MMDIVYTNNKAKCVICGVDIPVDTDIFAGMYTSRIRCNLHQETNVKPFGDNRIKNYIGKGGGF